MFLFLIQRKMVGDLFFLHLKSEKSIDFEHKRGVPGKGKSENFGCFMAICRSPDSPNGEFGGFWRFSDLRNAPVSNSPFCRNRDKSLQFNLKYRHKKSQSV